MKKYKVTVTPEALEDLNRYLSYILSVLKNEQAYDAVLKDYFETVDALSGTAGSINDSLKPELFERGLKEIHFRRHDYVMLFWIDGDEAVIVYIFHILEDYQSRI